MYLWSLREKSHNAIDLAETDDAISRNVGHTCPTIDGDKVMLAGRGQVDVVHQYHFVNLHFVLDSRDLRELCVIQP